LRLFPRFTVKDIGGEDGEVECVEWVRFLDFEVMDVVIIPQYTPGCFIFFNEIRGEDDVAIVYIIFPIFFIRKVGLVYFVD